MKIKNIVCEYLKKYHDDDEKMHSLAEFLDSFFEDVNSVDSDVYETFLDELKHVTFIIDEDVVEKAIDAIIRKDEVEGKKWSLSDTTEVAKQYNINKSDDFDYLKWYFAMNYAYASHYSNSRGIVDYASLAKNEYEDVNVPIEKKIKILYKKYLRNDLIKE